MTVAFEKGAKSIHLPPGRYIVGDPCYVVPDEEWDEVLDKSGFFNDQCWAPFKHDSGKETYVVAFSTAWGDGVYTDGQGRHFSVDAGLIGIIPYLDNGAVPCGTNLIEFQSDIYCSEENGKISFGKVVIDTDGDDDIDDIDEDDY